MVENRQLPRARPPTFVHPGRSRLRLRRPFLSGDRTALRQRPHFAGNDSEAAALLAGPSSLHRCVQRKDVSLEMPSTTRMMFAVFS
jgi:hypothetical protein